MRQQDWSYHSYLPETSWGHLPVLSLWHSILSFWFSRQGLSNALTFLRREKTAWTPRGTISDIKKIPYISYLSFGSKSIGKVLKSKRESAKGSLSTLLGWCAKLILGMNLSPLWSAQLSLGTKSLSDPKQRTAGWLASREWVRVWKEVLTPTSRACPR